MGGSEITFISGGKRRILTVTYKGCGGGSILFHQASWDPLFLPDIDPENPLDIPKLLSEKVSNLTGIAFFCNQACETCWSRQTATQRTRYIYPKGWFEKASHLIAISLLFKQATWDLLFLADGSLEDPLNLPQLLSQRWVLS